MRTSWIKDEEKRSKVLISWAIVDNGAAEWQTASHSGLAFWGHHQASRQPTESPPGSYPDYFNCFIFTSSKE